MSSTAQSFALAKRHHDGGNWQQAEALYRQIIQTEPTHAAAHHLLGLLAFQVEANMMPR